MKACAGIAGTAAASASDRPCRLPDVDRVGAGTEAGEPLFEPCLFGGQHAGVECRRAWR